jgi:hypothetical protein
LSVWSATWVMVVTAWVVLSAFARVAANLEEIEPADSTSCRMARPMPPPLPACAGQVGRAALQ